LKGGTKNSRRVLPAEESIFRLVGIDREDGIDKGDEFQLSRSLLEQ